MNGTILTGDALTMLRTLPDVSVHCCVTSPPYWGLRDYGVAGQIGLEATVGQVCVEEKRNFIGIELNPEYVAMAERRIAEARPHGPQQVSFWDMEATA